MAEKWYLCKEAVRVAGWALLEVESIDWVPVWGISKKPQYQMESMRRIEVNYTLSSEELEYMRMGRFVRMHANGNFMSFDDFCEKHNMARTETDPEQRRYKCDVPEITSSSFGIPMCQDGVRIRREIKNVSNFGD